MSAASLGLEPTGRVEPVPLAALLVPILIVNIALAAFGAYRHRLKYPSAEVRENEKAPEPHESAAVNAEKSPPESHHEVDVSYDDL